jgi:hypothetical protein
MSTMTMNMSSCEIEYSDSIAYSDEVMCAGWNPALAQQPCTESRKVIPAEMISIDTEMFLKKMYAYQR